MSQENSSCSGTDGLIWDLATAELIRMSEAKICPLHLVHVQTSRAVELIRQAKERVADGPGVIGRILMYTSWCLGVSLVS